MPAAGPSPLTPKTPTIGGLRDDCASAASGRARRPPAIVPMNARRDALHILDLLRHDRFPAIWIPDPATRELRALLMHRLRLVRIQTMLKNGVHALALNQGLARGSKLLRRAGLAQLQALPL